MSKLKESGAKWWRCYKLCVCLLHEGAFCSLTEEYEVALFLAAYTEVKLLGEEKKRDHELYVVISTLVGLRETRHALQSDFVQRWLLPRCTWSEDLAQCEQATMRENWVRTNSMPGILGFSSIFFFPRDAVCLPAAQETGHFKMVISGPFSDFSVVPDPSVHFPVPASS